MDQIDNLKLGQLGNLLCILIGCYVKLLGVSSVCGILRLKITDHITEQIHQCQFVMQRRGKWTLSQDEKIYRPTTVLIWKEHYSHLTMINVRLRLLSVELI